jgi:20S proteasome alpha/beta subunit
MTVIVYRDGVMAADTAAFGGGIISSVAERKVYRSRCGALIGCAGSKPDIYEFRAWADEAFENSKKPRRFKDFGAIVVAQDGAVSRYDDALREYPVEGPWAVEGCEEPFVTGCLAMGATAEQAVAAAIKHCAWAAGEVYVLRLNEPNPSSGLRVASWKDAAE